MEIHISEINATKTMDEKPNRLCEGKNKLEHLEAFKHFSFHVL